MVKQRLREETYLDNKQSADSRYVLTPMHIDGNIKPGNLRFSKWYKPPIDETNKDTWEVFTVPVQWTLRIDTISFQYYGRVDYWWAIAQVNDIKNPLEDIAVGTALYLPPVEEIEKALGIKK